MASSTYSRREKDADSGFGSSPSSRAEQGGSTREVNKRKYWPEELRTGDFRGPQGNMCVGNAYTLCWSEALGPRPSAEGEDAGPLATLKPGANSGPFSKLNMEVGIRYGEVRLRCKLDYRIKSKEASGLFKR